MTGPDSATWDLEIREVTAEDEGTYQCQVLATPGQPPLRSGNSIFTFSFLFLHSKTFRKHIKFQGLEAFRSANSINSYVHVTKYTDFQHQIHHLKQSNRASDSRSSQTFNVRGSIRNSNDILPMFQVLVRDAEGCLSARVSPVDLRT